MMISTPKKARQHLFKIKEEMNEFLQKKANHEMMKNQPKVLSLVDHMNSQGMHSNWIARKTLADHYGIKNYAGTKEQNGRILAILHGNTQHNATN